MGENAEAPTVITDVREAHAAEELPDSATELLFISETPTGEGAFLRIRVCRWGKAPQNALEKRSYYTKGDTLRVGKAVGFYGVDWQLCKQHQGDIDRLLDVQ